MSATSEKGQDAPASGAVDEVLERKTEELERANNTSHLLNQLSDSLVEDVNVWLNVLDTRLNVMLWNKVAEQISGYTRQEVVGHDKIWEWMYPDENYRRTVIGETLKLTETNQTLEYFETNVRCKNGDTKIISWNSRGLVDSQGRAYGAITFGLDITDRKRAEEALHKAHRDISALYHVASVASASLDLDTILERSLDCVLVTMKCDQGLIHLWDGDDGILRLVAHQGISADILAQIELVKPGTGLTGQVFQNATPLVTRNPASDPLSPRPICNEIMQAYVGVPMCAKGRVVGVFGVLGEPGRQFGTEEVALLASIADQVGVAVDNARLYQQAEQLAVMEERERLAHDLHDSVTQSLYSLTLLAEAGRRLIRAGELERAEDYLGRLGETAQHTLKEIRLLVYKLRPPALEQEGLLGAIQQRLGTVERRSGVKAHLLADDVARLPAPAEEGLYRIAQEALNNALKHAGASSVTVRIRVEEGCAEMEIVDDGCGFDPGVENHQDGVGLISMRERARKLGGVLHLDSAPGSGTRVSVRVPLGQCS